MTLTLEPLFLQCLYDHFVYVTRYCCHHSRGCWKFKDWSSYSPGRVFFNRLYSIHLLLGRKYTLYMLIINILYTNFKRPLVKIFWYPKVSGFFFLNLNQQSNLMKYHGLQCGFCTPGMVMTMYTLFRNNPSPTPDDLERALEGRKQNADSFFFLLT